MVFELDLTLLIALASLATSGLAFAKVFFNITRTITELQVKVDTMWNFTLRRGVSEVVMNNMGRINSPIVFTEKAEEIIAPLVPVLRELATEIGHLPEEEIAMELERRIGDKILFEVCIPHGLHLGACLLIAIEVVKGRLCSDNPEHTRDGSTADYFQSN